MHNTNWFENTQSYVRVNSILQGIDYDKYSVNGAFKGIPRQNIKEIKKIFQEFYGFSYIDIVHRYEMSVLEGEKPTKQLLKTYKKRDDPNNRNLPNELKSIIGSLYREIDINCRIDITLGCDGYSSEYYHGGSCYFSDHAINRDFIEHNGGGAIRIYDTTDTIVGRVWFVPMWGGMLVFNAYGDSLLNKIDGWRDLLSSILGISATFVHCAVNGDHSNFYSENKTMLFLGDPNAALDGAIINLEYPDNIQYYEGYTCESCGESCDEEDMRYIEYDGIDVCDYCVESDYTRVTAGSYEGEYLPDDKVTEISIGRSCDMYAIEDDDIVEDFFGEYQHYENCVIDEYGHYYPQDSDKYVRLEDGTIYPIDECEQNEDGDYVLS